MNTPQHAKIDLNAAITDAQSQLENRLMEIQREIATKYSELLLARLNKHLGRDSTETDWAKCSIKDQMFCFEEEKLMYMIVGELEWDGMNCKQEIRYIEC